MSEESPKRPIKKPRRYAWSSEDKRAIDVELKKMMKKRKLRQTSFSMQNSIEEIQDDLNKGMNKIIRGVEATVILCK